MLSDYFGESISKGALFARRDEDYAAKRIQFLPGVSAVSLDVKGQIVALGGI